ncbi:hypothetical protein LOTGIDRAFT_160806 [Lottia gigantea]|uniref:Neurotransmitter-gated ion-channel ligand-binding domain-containing protein n=1 Tax=Lottia gigantea TaxID=225164 RepID=V4C0R6_LOTGI|nr:hypothetical protein LOTGIDRAFT_160806 [Lottia gigantea]ESO95044.1 hypothetical protein LOTGIDRAFT_160806 [Lottia gigantea]
MKTLFIVLLSLLLARAEISNRNSGVYKAEEEYRANQSSLLRSLLDKCDPFITPVHNSSSRIQLMVVYGLISITGLNAQEQTLQTLSYLQVAWQDNLFRWNSDGNINDYFNVPSKLIWTPPIIVANAVEDTLAENMINGVSKISSDGEIYVAPLLRSKTTCRVDISRFPFDTQICEIRLGSTSSEVQICALSDDLTIFEPSNEWELLNLTSKPISLYEQEKRGGFVRFVLRRRWFFYLIKSVIPSYALSFINAFVFLLPAESGERMTMSISSFLSYAVYVTYIHESLPSNSDTNCYFLVYLCAMMVICACIILVSVFSLKLYEKAKEEKVPNWMTRLLSGKNSKAIDPSEKSQVVSTLAVSIEISKRFDKCCFFLFFTITLVTTVALSILYRT